MDEYMLVHTCCYDRELTSELNLLMAQAVTSSSDNDQPNIQYDVLDLQPTVIQSTQVEDEETETRYQPR